MDSLAAIVIGVTRFAMANAFQLSMMKPIAVRVTWLVGAI